MYCENCGTLLEDAATVCPQCDTPVADSVAAPPEEPPVSVTPPVPAPAAPPAPDFSPAAADPYHADNQADRSIWPSMQTLTEKTLPKKFRPLGAWSFFGWACVFSLPLVGLVLAIVFSFVQKNLCRRNFARFFLCVRLVLVLLVVATLVCAAVFSDSAFGIFVRTALQTIENMVRSFV